MRACLIFRRFKRLDFSLKVLKKQVLLFEFPLYNILGLPKYASKYLLNTLLGKMFQSIKTNFQSSYSLSLPGDEGINRNMPGRCSAREGPISGDFYILCFCEKPSTCEIAIVLSCYESETR